MQLQGKSVFALPLTLLTPLFLIATSQASCFDFSTRVSDLLHPLVSADQSGRLPQGMDWAAVRGVVDQPIEAVIKDLVEHRSTKSPRVDKMEIVDLKDPRYLAKHEARFEVDPFPFISVKWTEIWAFNMTSGTAEHPVRVVVSYEKTQGTSHIEHLCGNYVLQKAGENKTDVFIYEQAKATGRDVQDTLKGLKGNLKALDLKSDHKMDKPVKTAQ